MTDKFYTKNEIVVKCMKFLKTFLNENYKKYLDEYILVEPSAGNGAFVKYFEKKKYNYLAYDIAPEYKEIIEFDSLELDANILDEHVDEWYDIKDKKYFTIGNPPFGKNSSQAIKFFNICAKFSWYIAFIVPRTFKRVSVQNQLDKNFHLIDQFDLSLKPCCFEPKMDAKCCFQIWEWKEEIREKIIYKKTHPDFSFIKYGPLDDNNQPTVPELDTFNFVMKAYGSNCGQLKLDNFENLRPKSWHFIKVNEKNISIEELIDRFRSLDYSISKDTVRQDSLGQQELIWLYSKSHYKLNYNLGQYFTTNKDLQENLYNFILNKPKKILEPSIGRGDLVKYINQNLNCKFDMYEIDKNIQLLNSINKDDVIYDDFLLYEINETYDTIIGNPPYIKTKKGNKYIDFIKKCYNLLNYNGELIFIIPSDFFKLTSANILLENMMLNGTFTHIYHPHNEKLFEGANIDVLIFRYCKNSKLEKNTLYNNNKKYIINTNGLITFQDQENNKQKLFMEYFDIYVGIVSGKDEIYKNDKLGNISVLCSEGVINKFIFIENYPAKINNCKNIIQNKTKIDYKPINQYLLEHKEILMSRKIKKFNENNWYEWGAPRNMKKIKEIYGKDCIYIHNITRKEKVAFKGTVQYFSGNLLIMIPKCKSELISDLNLNLDNIVDYLNSSGFKNQFMYSNRFKIGHRQLSNSYF